MAIGGSFSADTFRAQTPLPLEWQQWQMYRDTQNPFASGSRIESARPSRFNYLGNTSPRSISSGGRDYGSQAIDRNEIARLEQMGSRISRGFGSLARRGEESGGGTGPTGTPTRPSQPAQEQPPSQRQQRRQARKLERQGVTPPPQPVQQQPRTLPAPVRPTPHPNASNNWREVQALRKAEWELGEPGQPTPDPPVDSRSYLEELARLRAERAGQPPAPPATSAQREERARQLKAERDAARDAAVVARGGRGPTPPGAVSNSRSPDLLPANMRPGAVGTAKIPTPMGLAGDQAERLSAEGATPAAPPKRTRKKS